MAGLFGYQIDPTLNPQGQNMIGQPAQQPQVNVNTTPFAGILPGDTYPGPTNPGSNFPQQPTNPKFPNLPTPSPWPGRGPNFPSTNVQDPGYNFLTQSGSQQQTGQQTGAQGEGQISTEPYDPSKYYTMTFQSGLQGGIKLPPKTYEEAGDYGKYIDAWRDFYNALRRSLGLGDQWDPNDIDKLKEHFDKLGIKYQAKPGEKWSSRIYIPDGKGGYIQIDTRGGQGESGWVNYGHTAQSMSNVPGWTDPNGAGGSGSSGGSGTAGLPGSGGMPGGDKWGGRADDLWNLLWQRMNQNKMPSKQDPIVRAQVNAFSAAQDRNARNYLADIAERSGPFTNMQGERRMASEKSGQATAAFQASVMQSELTARREEIAQALQLGAGFLTSQQQLELTRELGYLDAAIRQLSIANQNNQFFARLGFDVEDRSNFWDAIRRGLING